MHKWIAAIIAGLSLTASAFIYTYNAGSAMSQFETREDAIKRDASYHQTFARKDATDIQFNNLKESFKDLQSAQQEGFKRLETLILEKK